jgi:acylphosphatase
MPRSVKTTAKHLFISGKVQGVGYRFHLYQKANDLGLEGWCRNLPDGRVEALVRGEAEQIKEIIDWCHQGPPRSKVEKVEYFEVLDHIASLDDHSFGLQEGFEIR